MNYVHFLFLVITLVTSLLRINCIVYCIFFVIIFVLIIYITFIVEKNYTCKTLPINVLRKYLQYLEKDVDDIFLGKV